MPTASATAVESWTIFCIDVTLANSIQLRMRKVEVESGPRHSNQERNILYWYCINAGTSSRMRRTLIIGHSIGFGSLYSTVNWVIIPVLSFKRPFYFTEISIKSSEAWSFSTLLTDVVQLLINMFTGHSKKISVYNFVLKLVPFHAWPLQQFTLIMLLPYLPRAEAPPTAVLEYASPQPAVGRERQGPLRFLVGAYANPPPPLYAHHPWVSLSCPPPLPT
jgi:hypothetical protein